MRLEKFRQFSYVSYVFINSFSTTLKKLRSDYQGECNNFLNFNSYASWRAETLTVSIHLESLKIGK